MVGVAPTASTTFSSTPTPLDLDPDAVALEERDVARRDEAGPGQQDRPDGERERPAQPGGELLERPHDPLGRRLVFVDGLVAAADAHPDRERRRRLGRRHDRRAERAGAVVHLGLREVERVLALDAPRGHVVADREPDDAHRARRATSASSGSGTFQLESRRIPIGSPGLAPASRRSSRTAPGAPPRRRGRTASGRVSPRRAPPASARTSRRPPRPPGSRPARAPSPRQRSARRRRVRPPPGRRPTRGDRRAVRRRREEALRSAHGIAGGEADVPARRRGCGRARAASREGTSNAP